MDSFVGHRLSSVVRLAWHQHGKPDEHNVGPAHLVFDDERGVVIAGESDWSLSLRETRSGDAGWLAAYQYDIDEACWLSRDASQEQPFASVIGCRLQDWEPLFDEANQPVGLRLGFDGESLTLRLSAGELVT